MRILIIEDDDRSGDYLHRALNESGYVVDRARDGEDGLALAREEHYDALIVDRRLPGLDGILLVKHLRAAGVATPVLMLSGVARTADRINGLHAGCDDYLAKPYAFSEVLARLEALLRRADRAHFGRLIEIGDLRLDLVTREVSRAGRSIRLQRREAMILEILMRHAGEIITRLMIMDAVWPSDFDPRGNIVDMHMHRLRRKLDIPGRSAIIRTVAGGGYMLVADGDEPSGHAADR